MNHCACLRDAIKLKMRDGHSIVPARGSAPSDVVLNIRSLSVDEWFAHPIIRVYATLEAITDGRNRREFTSQRALDRFTYRRHA